MTTPIVVKVEAAWGANLTAAPATWTWTDITSDLRASTGVNIVVGRSDEAGQTQPTQVTFTVNDPSGYYIPRNARGINYPYVRQNTPFRISFGGNVRAIVYADSYASTWDESLTKPIVTISASGILHRLSQGAGQNRSAMRQRIESLSPVAFWPLEDGTTQSALSGGAAMVENPVDSWVASSTAQLPAGAAGAITRNQPEALLSASLPTPATSSIRIDFALMGTPADVNTTQLKVLTIFGYSLATLNIDTLPPDGLWHHHRIEVYNSGGATLDWYIDGVAVFSGFSLLIAWANVAGIAFGKTGAGANTDSLSNVGVWAPRISTDTYYSFQGDDHELITDRLSRICGERGVPIAVTGTATTRMGVQTPNTFIGVLRACETADIGILTDGGANGGLTYLARPARYGIASAIVLDNSLNQLAMPFQPIEDDQRRRNDWTVSRTSGNSGRYVDTTGPQGTLAVSTYDDSVTIGVSLDEVLVDQAGWRVHLGTAEQMRYPQVSIQLDAHPELVSAWIAAGVGSRFTLRNLPSQHQPGDIDLIIEGYTERCDGFEWRVEINAGTYDPWLINTVESVFFGRVDTDGSTLTAGVSAAATSLSVATTGSNPIWTTTATFAGDFPFDVGIDGEQLTVTAIVGTSSPQTFTVKRAVNGVSKAHVTGAAVSLWRPGVLGL